MVFMIPRLPHPNPLAEGEGKKYLVATNFELSPRSFHLNLLDPRPIETVSQLTRAGQKKNSFEKQKHNSIEQRYAKVRGKERGSDGVPIRESRAVRAVNGEYRRLREPGRPSTCL